MRGNSGLVVVAFLAALLAVPVAFAAGQGPKVDYLRVDELIAMHDSGMSVSIGNYFLKQEPLLSMGALHAQVLCHVEQCDEIVRRFVDEFESASI